MLNFKSMCNAIENQSSCCRGRQRRSRALSRAGFLGAILFWLASAAPAQIATSSNSLASSNIFAGYSFFADNLFSGQHADLNGWHVWAKKYLPYFRTVGDLLDCTARPMTILQAAIRDSA